MEATRWRDRITEFRYEPVGKYLPNENNARVHGDSQRKVVNRLLDDLGKAGVLLAYPTNDGDKLINGHLRQDLDPDEPWHIAITDFDQAEADKFLTFSDASGEMAGYDPDLLKNLLDGLPGTDELEDLVAQLQDAAGLVLPQPEIVEDEVPDPPSDPITKTGDLWILGEHKVLCGDSTKAEDVARLIDGDRACLCFTSPPYAEQRKEQYGGISPDRYIDWFRPIQANIRQALSETGVFILNIKPHAKDKQRHLYVFDLVCSLVRTANWLLVDEFCWLRSGIPQQVVNRYKNAFEPCYWFAASENYKWNPRGACHESDHVPKAMGPGAGDTNAARRQGKGGGAIQGNEIISGVAYPSNVLDFKNNADALGHPAAFPVQLPSFFLRCMTQSGGSVYDPFLGSGTTLIAAQQLNRRCFGLEISPAYCDVAVKRWENLTGKKAERINETKEAPENVTPSAGEA